MNDYDELPQGHRNVLDHCIREAWTNLEAGDAHTEADIAADIAQRLVNVYGVTTYDDERDHEETLPGGEHCPVGSGYLDGGCRCKCGWTGAWDEYAGHAGGVGENYDRKGDQ